jgi:hypothetical protein
MHDLTSSNDAGRLYVERKFLANWLSSSPQLPMESLGSVFNQDRAAPVRCNCKLYIAVALVPPSICTAVDSLTNIALVPVTNHIFPSHVVT